MPTEIADLIQYIYPYMYLYLELMSQLLVIQTSVACDNYAMGRCLNNLTIIIINISMQGRVPMNLRLSKRPPV